MLGQMLLFGSLAAAATRDPQGPAAEAEPPRDDAQLDLFGAEVLEKAAIERLLEACAFSEALIRHEALRREAGDFFASEDMTWLAPLASCPQWRSVPSELRRAWRASRDRAPAWRRSRLADSLLASLDGEIPAEVTEDDVLLADACNAHVRAGRESRARLLVRDALLRGRELPPDDFDDPPTRDVLREPLPARWIASVGFLRRVWPLADGALDGSPGATAPLDDDARALEFWRCLAIAEDRDAPEGVIHSARRRLRELGPELHATYMRMG